MQGDDPHFCEESILVHELSHAVVCYETALIALASTTSQYNLRRMGAWETEQRRRGTYLL